MEADRPRVEDQGQYAKKFKQSHPEEYEKYREWAKAEEAAYEEAEAAAAAAAQDEEEEEEAGPPVLPSIHAFTTHT